MPLNSIQSPRPLVDGDGNVQVEVFGPGRTAIAYDTTSARWGLVTMPAIVPRIGYPGIVRAAVQRQPDTRIHFVRSDGTVGTSTSVLQPMQLLRLESGGTDPGSFAGMSGGAR